MLYAATYEAVAKNMLPFLLSFCLFLQQQLLLSTIWNSLHLLVLSDLTCGQSWIHLFVLDSVSAKSIFQQRSCQQVIIFSLVTKILCKVHTEVKSTTVKTYNGYLPL